MQEKIKDDTISRQAAIDALMEILDRPNHAEFLYTDEICGVLGSLPSAQPERKTGHWEDVPHKSVEHGEVIVDGKTVRCSVCRHAEKGWNKGMNFCPNCGAYMTGKEGAQNDRKNNIPVTDMD